MLHQVAAPTPDNPAPTMSTSRCSTGIRFLDRRKRPAVCWADALHPTEGMPRGYPNLRTAISAKYGPRRGNHPCRRTGMGRAPGGAEGFSGSPAATAPRSSNWSVWNSVSSSTRASRALLISASRRCRTGAGRPGPLRRAGGNDGSARPPVPRLRPRPQSTMRLISRLEKKVSRTGSTPASSNRWTCWRLRARAMIFRCDTACARAWPSRCWSPGHRWR